MNYVISELTNIADIDDSSLPEEVQKIYISAVSGENIDLATSSILKLLEDN